MDKHLTSVGKEMAYVWCNFIIKSMKLGCIFAVIIFLMAMIAMPFKIAIVIPTLILVWCAFWIATFKLIIKTFKLDQIEYV